MVTTNDNQLRVEEDERARLLGDIRYAVSLSLRADDPAPTFASQTTVDFRCRTKGAATFVNLTAARVHSVVLNSHELTADEHAFNGRRLNLPGLREGDNHLVVVADCAYDRSGVGLHRFVDPIDATVYTHTSFEPFDAHRVLACFDQPSLKAMLTMHVEAPDGWMVCANGAVAGSRSADGRTTWSFATTPPLPTYLFAVAAGEYDVIEGAPHRDTPLRLMCRRSLTRYLRGQADEIFDITRRGLAHFEKRYGHGHPFGAYTQVFVPEANFGAMENPGCVTFNEMFIHRGPVSRAQRSRRANVILHEMAHVMGFGDVVTMRDWGDLWLNETFATVEATFAVDALGLPGAWVDFAGMVKSRALQQDQLSTTHPILVDAPDTDSIRANFDGITYHKGASALRQLIAWVGDEPYAAGIRAYFREFAWGNATRTDFLAHQARESGRDLSGWAHVWLETAGVNTLTASPATDGGRYAAVSLRQLPDAAAGVLRPHHVNVGLYDRDGDGIHRRTAVVVEITGGASAIPELAGQPVAAVVIANDEDLSYAKLRFDAASLATLLDGGVAAIDDAHTRSLCWTALHDMARDAELRAGAFVAAVVAQTAQETDELVLERLLAAAAVVAERYTADHKRGQALATLANAALARLPSTPAPLVWARCLAATARDEAQLDTVAGLIDGVVQIAGLEVDVELRWLLLARLATEGRAGAAEIMAALEVDPTDAGQRRADACLSARPTAEAKAAAWAAAVEGSSLGRARLQAALSGFTAGLFSAGGFHAGGRDQVALTGKYVAAYLKAVPATWSEREYEVARVVTQGLFPDEPADAATIASVERLIDGGELQVSCRRILMEGRDGLVRARAARAADALAG
ncbi:MAG TPA: aminopeptidase N [Candidatus Dormibacteraeota bacterium]|nr:aminopeptidase N [Candidatus Dormibacteraeota bacterium]